MALGNHALKTGEARIIGLRVDRAVGETTTRIAPDSATIQVVDAEDEDVIPVTAATISGCTIYHLISVSDVTAAAGTYKAIWSITEGTEIFIDTQTITVTDP